MTLDTSFTLKGQTYALKAVFYHYGTSPSSGHYVTAARQAANTEEFFIYNDDIRREVSASKLTSDAHLEALGIDVIHASACLYELQ